MNLPVSFNNVTEIQLSELELPLTFYAISKEQGNNFFWLRMVANEKIKNHFNMEKWVIGDSDYCIYTNVNNNTSFVNGDTTKGSYKTHAFNGSINLEKTINDKWKALNCYTSETQRYPLPRSKQGLFNLARVRGSQCGREFSEAFRLIRSFKK